MWDENKESLLVVAERMDGESIGWGDVEVGCRGMVLGRNSNQVTEDALMGGYQKCCGVVVTSSASAEA